MENYMWYSAQTQINHPSKRGGFNIKTCCYMGGLLFYYEEVNTMSLNQSKVQTFCLCPIIQWCKTLWIMIFTNNIVQAAGKYKQEGKTYVVQDGDIIFFKFNVSGGGKKWESTCSIGNRVTLLGFEMAIKLLILIHNLSFLNILLSILIGGL